MNKRFLVSLLLFITTLSYGQTPIWHYWADLNPSVKLNERTKLFGDAGVQVFNMQSVDVRLNIRPGVSYTINSTFKATAGLGYFVVFGDGTAALHELRPFLGLQAKWPNMRNFNPVHYIRYEARNVWFTGDYDNFYESRFRYEIKEEIKLSHESSFLSNWYVPIAAEVFIGFPANSEVFSNFQRLRITAGLGYHFNTNNRIELLYLYQGSEANVFDTFLQTTDHMLRLRYFISF